MASQTTYDCATGEITVNTAYTPPTPPPSPPPTVVTPLSGAGTGASAVLHQPAPSINTDIRGIVDITIGTSPTVDSAGHYQLVSVTFGTPWPIAPLGAMIDRVKLTTEDPTALGFVFSGGMTTTEFIIVAESAPIAGVTYRLTYALG